MNIVCAWCRQEGQDGIVGAKAPFNDQRETHGICYFHYLAVGRQWHETLRVSDDQELRHASDRTEEQEPALDTHESFTRSAVHWWKGLKQLARKASGF